MEGKGNFLVTFWGLTYEWLQRKRDDLLTAMLHFFVLQLTLLMLSFFIALHLSFDFSSLVIFTLSFVRIGFPLLRVLV